MSDSTSAIFHLLACDPALVRPERYELEADRCVIGRHPDCTIVVTGYPGVSRQHAVVLREHPGSMYFVLEDNASTYGTFVNGQPLEPRARHRLCHDDLIGLGSPAPVLRVLDTDVTKAPEATAPPPRLLVLDEEQVTFYLRGAPLRLTRNEERLLLFLYRNRGRVCRIERCIEAVWYDEATHPDSRRESLHTLVSALRKTLRGEDWPAPVVNYRELGYELKLPEQ